MEGKWGSPSWNSQDGEKMKYRRDLEITRDCTTIVHTYLLCISYPLLGNSLPTQQRLNTYCPPAGQGYVQSSWVPLAPDTLPGLSLHVTDGFLLWSRLLLSSTWLLVAQAHSVAVSRVHVLTGCWPEIISGHRFLHEATHVMVTCFLQSWGTKGTQRQVGLSST